MLSPSDIIIRPASLHDRLAAEASPESSAPPEPTPTIMAERFAPEGQKGNGITGQPAEPQVMAGIISGRSHTSSGGRWLLPASMIISLVPTAIILALMWKGAIAIPGTGSRAPVVFDHDEIAGLQEASLAAVPAMKVAVTSDAEEDKDATKAAKPDIALTAPAEITAKTGEQVGFDIMIDSSEPLPARSVIAVRSMPEGASFSQGRPYGEGEWNLRPDEIGDLRLTLPKTATGNSEMQVELMAADGTVLASASTKLDVALDPKAALILRSDESSRVTDLIAHGQKMVSVGYFAGARAYFRRAAEAGSGDAALRLAATYDQAFIDKIGAQGIKPDPNESRIWYERAKELGVEDIETKFKALKEDWSRGSGSQPVQTTQADAPLLAPAVAAAEPKPDQPAPETAPDEDTNKTLAATAPFSVGKDAWVAFLSAANVRSAPSSNAETIKVAEKGTKFRATGRKGNWVQVTDPATSETGWVYSRYIETAEAPAR
jgi:hypothetical protein